MKRIRQHLAWTVPLLAAVASWLGIVAIAEYGHTDGMAGLGAFPLFAILVAGLVLAARNGWRIWRRFRGRPTRREAVIGQAWNTARILAAGLAAHKRLTPLTVWGLILERDETAHLDLHANYRRAGTAQQPFDVRVILTDQRLLCEAATEWQSFWYEHVTGFYPDLDHWAVTLDFADTAPLQLSGMTAPTIAVYLTERLYGPEGLATHPALERLRAS